MSAYKNDSPPPYPGTSRSTYPSEKSATEEYSSETPRIEDIAASNPESEKIILYSADERVRTIFMRKVFLMLVLEGIFICGLIALCLYLPQFRDYWFNMSSMKFWFYWILALALATSITGFNKLMRFSPMNMILACMITCASGGLLGSLAGFLAAEKILISTGIITAICLCVVIFTLQPKYNLTPKINILITWTLVGATYGFLCICFTMKQSLWISIGPLAFLTYIGAASQLVMRNYQKLPDDECLRSNEVLYGTTSILMLLVHIVRDFVMTFIPCCRPCANCIDNCSKSLA